MAQPFMLQVRGVIQLQPFAAIPAGPSQRAIGDIDILASYSQRMADSPSIINATSLAPYVVPFGTVTKANFVAIRQVSGALYGKLTTANETDQIVRFAGGWLIVWVPNAGEEITAVKLIGTGDAETFIAGN